MPMMKVEKVHRLVDEAGRMDCAGEMQHLSVLQSRDTPTSSSCNGLLMETIWRLYQILSAAYCKQLETCYQAFVRTRGKQIEAFKSRTQWRSQSLQSATGVGDAADAGAQRCSCARQARLWPASSPAREGWSCAALLHFASAVPSQQQAALQNLVHHAALVLGGHGACPAASLTCCQLDWQTDLAHRCQEAE